MSGEFISSGIAGNVATLAAWSAIFTVVTLCGTTALRALLAWIDGAE